MNEKHSCNLNSNDHYRSCISLVPLFSGLTKEQMDQVADLAYTAQYSQHETIYHEGDRSEGLYIIHRGRIKVYRLSENGKEQIVRMVGPGDFTGELSLFNEMSHDAYADTIEPAEVCIIPRAPMQQLLHDHPTISLKMLSEISSRLASTEQHTARIAMETMDVRIAMYLADLSEEQQQLTVTLPMSRKDLASYLGTTPETISRKLGAFEEQGWIHQNGTKTVKILDLDGLLLV